MIPPVRKLDFSKFHPMDHHLGDSRCRRLPGGPRWHVTLWWKYMRPGWMGGPRWESLTPVTPRDKRDG